MTPEDVKRSLEALTEQVGRVVVGADDHVRLAFIAILVRGHLLLEGVPGTGKTLLAHCLSKALGLEMRRLQCTPDLMPGDVLGANLFDFRTQTFALTKGPVFTEILLADEINRTPPKTQSALLEAMQERSVTVDGVTHRLSGRFTVLATQNPIEQEGTYPLPEAQLDRFLFELLVGYPTREEELRAVITHGTSAGMPEIDLSSVLRGDDVDALRAMPARVRLDPKVAEYVVDLARATRDHPSLAVGLSPRAAAVLAAAARAAALTRARDFVVPDDVKSLFVPLARHRVVRTPSAEMEGQRSDEILSEIADSVRPPR
jgi:MoxR-like ATPase